MKLITIEQFLIALLAVSNLYLAKCYVDLRKTDGAKLAKNALKYVKDTEKKLEDMRNEVNRVKGTFDDYLLKLEERIRKTINMYYDSVHKYNDVVIGIYGVAHDSGESKTLSKIENVRDDIQAIYDQMDELKTLWPEFYEENENEETRV